MAESMRMEFKSKESDQKKDKKYHLLYVDDEVDNLVAFKAVFRRLYQISTAESSAQALEILKDNDIDIVISDQRMPEKTGVELLEEIKTKYPQIIRMILTGYSDMEAIIGAINQGKIYHYFTKPWEFEEVKVVIDNALELLELKQENQNLTLQNAQLEKENIQAQFEVLKDQLQPHFLFNSMNVLISLIPLNTQKAIKYATDFSKLYRKLLELKDQQLIDLEQELDFINHYIALQKTRFDESLHININIPENQKAYCLPPFTIQLLLENAIKHNIISDEKPLYIEMDVAEDTLVVKNNLQLRGGVKASTGIGLKNLRARFNLVTDQMPEFSNSGEEYIAKVPLIPEI